MRSNSKHTRRVKHDKQREPWNISASSILLITTRSITHINNNNNIKRGVCFLYRQFLYSYHKNVLVLFLSLPILSESKSIEPR